MAQVLNPEKLRIAALFFQIKYCPVERVEIFPTNNYRTSYLPILECHKIVKWKLSPFFSFAQLIAVVVRAYGCIAAAPQRVFVICFFFQIFYDVNIFYNVIVHTLVTNAPVYVA